MRPTTSPPRWLVGCDTGGTFTDVIAVGPDGALCVAKVPSTPPDFDRGVLSGLEAVGVPPEQVRTIFHGTTVTTNAVLAKTGPRCALITTRGFRDVLEIRRANRQELYDILWDPPPPLIPRRDRLEVDERIDYSGAVVVPLDEGSVRDTARKLAARDITSVAVCLINAHANPAHERRVAELLLEQLPDIRISISTDVLPEPPEFERTATTVANAYCAPVLAQYLGALEQALRPAGYASDSLLVMTNGGGTMRPDHAGRYAVKTLNSGVAAGVIGGAALAEACQRPNVVSMDMGGTSTDIAVIRDGRPRLTRSFDVEWGTPIRFPSVDVVSIGAGGGSIAWLDAAGYPRSGPHSAGAAPGPASYGLGGVEPTTTDAHLVLGRLSNDRFLEGAMELDAELAARAIDSRIAEPLGLSTEAAAEGILRIANATMAKAIRLVTVERGLDPRDFSLIAFGGAGGLHAVDLARDLGMREVILPAYPGLMSAYGLLFVDPVDDFSWAYVREVSAIDIAELGALLGSLRDRVVRNLVQQGVDESSIEVGASVDLRYLGQLHTITVPLAGARRTALDEAVAGFHGQHREEFGYAAPGNPVESAALRVSASGARTKPQIGALAPSGNGASRVSTRSVHLGAAGWVEATIVDRTHLSPGDRLEAPCVVEAVDTTIVVPPGASGRVDDTGNVVLDVTVSKGR